ncbi:MAG: hypothetical protein U0V74_17405 [Chitinophagales bacterium]
MQQSFKCPDLATGRRSHHMPLFAKAATHGHSKKSVSVKQTETAERETTKVDVGSFTASADKGMVIPLPPKMGAELTEQEIQEVNTIFRENSDGRVGLEKRGKKVVVKMKSPVDYLKLSKNLRKSTTAPAASAGYLDDRGSKMAFASGILGIVGFVLAFGPFIGFFAFACAVAAIVLGVFGLGSARRGWAIAGIVLGAVTLLIALLFILFVFSSLVF